MQISQINPGVFTNADAVFAIGPVGNDFRLQVWGQQEIPDSGRVFILEVEIDPHERSDIERLALAVAKDKGDAVPPDLLEAVLCDYDRSRINVLEVCGCSLNLLSFRFNADYQRYLSSGEFPNDSHDTVFVEKSVLGPDRTLFNDEDHALTHAIAIKDGREPCQWEDNVSTATRIYRRNATDGGKPELVNSR